MSGPRRTYLTDPVLTGFNVTVGDNIRRLREARGLTRGQLAELAGVPPRNVENTEAGVVSPSFWTIAKLACVLRTPVGALTAVNEA